MSKLVHDFLFAGAELVGVGDVEQRWQVLVEQFIDLAIEGNCAVFGINLIEHQAVIHMVFGMTTNDLTFEFELDDGDGLVHLGHQLSRTLQTRIVVEVLGLPDGARVIAIDLHSEVGERQKIDAVTLFKCLDIGITDRDAEHRCNESEVAGSCSHPFDVVVAPLDVEIVVARECVHDFPSTGTTIEDVAYNVE